MLLSNAALDAIFCCTIACINSSDRSFQSMIIFPRMETAFLSAAALLKAVHLQRFQLLIDRVSLRPGTSFQNRTY
jgi:hypothetical protein